MFGNITGGGTLSSKTDYNPTPYVDVILKDFTKLPKTNNLSENYKKDEQHIVYITFKIDTELDFINC